MSRKLGLSRLPKYHIAASTHRYDMFSDTAGGWGFYEVPIPAEYLARVIIANAFVLPPSGLSFEASGAGDASGAGGPDDARMFGAGWIATPLFSADAQPGKEPLTWTFFAEAENFAGPVCCYPPQMFTRRIAEWSAFRRKEDASAGGEFPNLKAAFARDGGFWKIPQITLPFKQKTNVWASHFGLYFEDNYERMRAALADPTLARFELVAETNVKCSVSHSAELGVKTVRDASGRPAYTGVEVDHRIRMPMVVRVVEGPSVVYEWNANTELERSRALTRYVRTSTENADVIVNGNGESSQRKWCDFVAEHAAPVEMHALEYESEEVPGPKEYRSRAAEPAFSTHGSVYTLTLEDGAVVSYRWYRFVDQPAIAQLTREFPRVFTAAELDRLQDAVVRMHTHWGGANKRSFLKHDYPRLVSIETALFVSRPEWATVGYVAIGDVPVAVGLEYPARAPNGVPAEPRRW
jgi:hypothetical protein